MHAIPWQLHGDCTYIAVPVSSRDARGCVHMLRCRWAIRGKEVVKQRHIMEGGGLKFALRGIDAQTYKGCCVIRQLLCL